VNRRSSPGSRPGIPPGRLPAAVSTIGSTIAHLVAASRPASVSALDNSSEGVRLWDVADRVHPRRLAALPGNGETTRTVAFTPDGHTLGIAGGDHYTLWDVTRRAEMASNPVGRACAIVGRGLSSAEWTNYAPGLPYQRTCPG